MRVCSQLLLFSVLVASQWAEGFSPLLSRVRGSIIMSSTKVDDFYNDFKSASFTELECLVRAENDEEYADCKERPEFISGEEMSLRSKTVTKQPERDDTTDGTFLSTLKERTLATLMAMASLRHIFRVVPV